MALAPGGISDASGNSSSFGPRSPLDRAAPVLVGFGTSNVGTPGLPEPGDSLQLAFSEPVQGLPAATSLVLADGRRSDTVDIAGVLHVGGSTLGSTGYVVPGKGKTAPASFPATTSVSERTVVVTLTGPCTGACALQPSTGVASLTAAPTLTATAVTLL